MATETRITLEELEKVLFEKFQKHGMAAEEASETARIFAFNAGDGVISHSVLRVKRLIGHLDCGLVVPGRVPQLVSGFGGLERYDANGSAGTTSGVFCTRRAITLAKEHGIGMVALRNANHWMRGGYYGWLAADEGLVYISWTNTMPNLPAWGTTESTIGNNPFVMAVPGKDGHHMVLDMAMSQFSNGKIEVTRRAGKMLPVDGGYDREGKLTRVPGEIEQSKRPLPIGFWKGSSMAIVLDAAAALLSDGLTTTEVGKMMKETGKDECLVSQVFLAIAPEALGPNGYEEAEELLKRSVWDAPAVTEGRPARYPGERVLLDRAKAAKEGILVSSDAWEEIKAL